MAMEFYFYGKRSLFFKMKLFVDRAVSHVLSHVAGYSINLNGSRLPKAQMNDNELRVLLSLLRDIEAVASSPIYFDILALWLKKYRNSNINA